MNVEKMFIISGKLLSLEWLRYKYGVFSEHGFSDDPLYPLTYPTGPTTQPSTGCDRDVYQLCPTTKPYNRQSPTKQNMLCAGRSAREVISSVIKGQQSNSLSNKEENDQKPPEATEENHSISTPYVDDNTWLRKSTIKSLATPLHSPDAPQFLYTLSITTKYRIVLDQSVAMGDKLRWTNIRRSLHRFLELLPVGSVLSVVTVGQSMREVLPATTVTDLNRDGLYGRIPRRVTSNPRPCIECAINHIVSDIGDNEVVIVITGDTSKLDDDGEVLDKVDDKKVPIFLISYPQTLHTSYLNLAKYGGVYAVVEGSQHIHPRLLLQEILMDILKNSDNIHVDKIHETVYQEEHLKFSGKFTFQSEKKSNLRVTLNIPDEEKVEYFEVEDPNGENKIFSNFEDGMVYFKFSGILPTGIWSYRVKMYRDTVIPEDEAVTVDVTVNHEDSDEVVKAEIFTNVENNLKEDAEQSVIVFARITSNGSPVLNADATVQMYLPSQSANTTQYSIVRLHDNGLGYPDITSGDGIYTAHVPILSTSTGYAMLRLEVTATEGQAVTSKSLMEKEVKGKNTIFSATTVNYALYFRRE